MIVALKIKVIYVWLYLPCHTQAILLNFLIYFDKNDKFFHFNRVIKHKFDIK